MATRPWILAIDFGTSYTVAAALVDGRSAEVIEIDGNRRVPSVVLAEGDTYVVGKLADELAATYPGRTLRAPKRRIGDAAPVVLDGRPHNVVDLIAALLHHVYEEAVRQYGSAPEEVRLTHPAVWVRPQLNRLLEAAAKAGIQHAVLVPEPVAAALAYATEVGVADGAHVAVYDLGGGTFDTAVVTPAEFGFQIIGRPGGDSAIGGELFDELLAEYVGAQLDPGTWEQIQFSDNPTWRRLDANLRHEVRRGKEMLSGYPVTEILVPVPGELVQLRVTREEYEALIEPHIEATVDLLDRCVRDSGTDPAQLAAVYLVGGASRTPLATTTIERRFPGIPISRRGDPKTSTAFGAALAVRSQDLSSGAAVRAGQGAPTPPPTPFGGGPVSKPPSVPPISAPPAGPPAGMVAAASGPAPRPASGPAAGLADAPTAVLPSTPTTTAATGRATAVLPSTHSSPPPRRRRRAGLWFGLGALVVAGGVGAGVVLATSKGDDSADSATTAATTAAPTSVSATSAPPAAGNRCVRQDIDFAALRDGPSKDAKLLGRIPAGSCDVAVSERVKATNGTASWLRLSWSGTQGYSAESNFLPAGTDPSTVTTAAVTVAPTTATTPTPTPGSTTAGGMVAPGDAPTLVAVVNQYFTLINVGDITGAWNLLSTKAQQSFKDFDAFTQIWIRVPFVEIHDFTGCTSATAPADCLFVGDYTNAKGGITRANVTFNLVFQGPDLRIDGSELSFLACVKKNPGENNCSAT